MALCGKKSGYSKTMGYMGLMVGPIWNDPIAEMGGLKISGPTYVNIVSTSLFSNENTIMSVFATQLYDKDESVTKIQTFENILQGWRLFKMQ